MTSRALQPEGEAHSYEVPRSPAGLARRHVGHHRRQPEPLDLELLLESRLERLGTLLFHKKLGSYGQKATRIETLARWIAADLIAQAEHDPDARAVLITSNPRLAE